MPVPVGKSILIVNQKQIWKGAITMNIKITGKNFDVTDALKERVNKSSASWTNSSDPVLKPRLR